VIIHLVNHMYKLPAIEHTRIYILNVVSSLQ